MFKNKNFLKAKKNNSAFTLMEVMVSIAILGIISSAVFTVISTLFYDGKKDKAKIEMNAEIVDSVAIIEKYIKEGEELKILDSKLGEKNILGNQYNGILVKNKNSEIKSSLFTLIKPLEKELSGDFGEKTIGDKKYHLGITELNLFSDIVKTSDGKIIFSDPGNGNIWEMDSNGNNPEILFGGNNSLFLTPTGLFLSDNFLYISDTYQNLIFRVGTSDFSGDLSSRNNSLEIIAGKKGDNGNVISGYQDGSLGRNTLNHPKGLTLYDNKLYFADSGNNAIRFIDLSTNNVETFIGNGKAGISEDGVFHQEFLLNNPTDIDIRDDIGMLLISDTNNNRIVASGPASGNNSYSKPFTISGVGKTEFKNLADGVFNLDDEFIGSKDEKIEEEKNIGKMGFGGDFFLANNAILNHPTGIKFFGTGGFIFSDSGNNLIRKVSVWNFGDGADLNLFDNQNRIETIIGNASEVLIKKGDVVDGKKMMDIKISTSSPKSGNKSGSGKLSLLDNPMGISFSGSDILFTDLQIFKKKLYGKINLCDGDCLNGAGNLDFLKEKAFNALNLDKISITNLGDFISKTPIDLMQFTEKKINNGSEKLVQIYLKFIDYLRVDDGISVDVKTSVKNLIKD